MLSLPEKAADLDDEEHVDWVPSLNLATPPSSQESSEETISQTEEVELQETGYQYSQQETEESQEVLSPLPGDAPALDSLGSRRNSSDIEESLNSIECKCEECQTDLTGVDIEEMEKKIKKYGQGTAR